MGNSRHFIHYLVLVGAIALGTLLRFWNLDLKPLWMDEVITALFSLGRSYLDVPLNIVFPLERLEQLFTLKPAVGCVQIAQTVAAQSTHPPLFFCLMHAWVESPLIGAMQHGWVWAVRSLPALCGVGAIAAVYGVNARAFSPGAGLMGAALMAVSPFAVYLSQEARHYTMPMLFITLALLGLIQIQQDLFCRQQLRLGVWLGWVVVNSIGLYIHYFFILAGIAQLATLLVLVYSYRVGKPVKQLPRHTLLATFLSVAAVGLSYLPWLPVMLHHFSRSETSWLPPPDHLAPLFQTLISWLLIFIALPVEHQPLWVSVPSGLLMVLFGIWVAWRVFRGLRQLWSTPATHLATLTLLSFTFCVLLEFFAVVYLFGKDITVVPRYNFVYYPSIYALLGASLAVRVGRGVKGEGRRVKGMGHGAWGMGHGFVLCLFTFSLLSCVLVVFNFVLQKPFQPEQVARNMNQEPAVPLMVVVAYRDYQDVALGLSFALALKKVRSESTAEFAFLQQSPGIDSIWYKLSQLAPLVAPKLNLWVVGPGIRRRDYIPHLALSVQRSCTIDPNQHYRIGVPYQLYRCGEK